jgi:uncharacterized protein (TIGR03790 family)
MISLLLSPLARAGLGPAHTVVLYNAADPDAYTIAETYDLARQLPPGHLCPVDGVDPLVDQISWELFDSAVRGALETCLSRLPQPEEIDAIVTVRGLPYVVELPEYVVGLEAALAVGRGVGPAGEIAGTGQLFAQGVYQASVPNPDFTGSFCDDDDLALSNPYQGWYDLMCGLQSADKLPMSFRARRQHESGGYDLGGELRIVSRLDGFELQDALALVDRGVTADGAAPSGELLCMQGADEARSARDPECELTARKLSEAGLPGVWVSPHDPALSGHEVVSYLTGAENLREAIEGVTFAPGAFACNLTSYGAVPANFRCDDTGTVCPASESQTSIARFVRAGATGAHGTVAEPLNNPFPNAGMLVLYTSGYSLGESVLFASPFLYWQNLTLGDPLATPFAQRPAVSIPAEIAEGEPVVIEASHPDGVQEIHLYVDGVHVAETEGDVLTWEHGTAQGAAFELLAVATAGDHTYERPGWNTPSQLARPDTQGWTTAMIVVSPALAEGDTGEGEQKGCGCGSSGRAGLGVALLAVLLARVIRHVPREED